MSFNDHDDDSGGVSEQFAQLHPEENRLTLAGRFLSNIFLGGGGAPPSVVEGSRNSCIIQSVLMPLAALPL